MTHAKIMKQTYFKFNNHPGDLFRNQELVLLPNYEDDLERFWVSFLDNYQSDYRIASIDDLSKLINDELENDNQRAKLFSQFEIASIDDAKRKLAIIEDCLKREAFENFYKLVAENKIQIVND